MHLPINFRFNGLDRPVDRVGGGDPSLRPLSGPLKPSSPPPHPAYRADALPPISSLRDWPRAHTQGSLGYPYSKGVFYGGVGAAGGSQHSAAVSAAVSHHHQQLLSHVVAAVSAATSQCVHPAAHNATLSALAHLSPASAHPPTPRGAPHPAFYPSMPPLLIGAPALTPAQLQHMMAADGGLVAQYLNSCEPLARAALMELTRMGSYPLGKKLFGCPQCRYITDRKNNLKRHVTTMHADCDKLLECCGVPFSNKAALRDHVLVFHANGYMCRYCGRNFCRKALLKRHLAVHSGQKDFVCDHCDYATSHKSNLERHRKVHERGGEGEDDSDDSSRSDSRDGRDVSSRDVSGRDVSGRDVSGRDVSGRDVSGRDVSGLDVSGRDVTGRDVSGRDVSGRDVIGRDVSGHDVTGRDLNGRDVNRRDVSSRDFVSSHYISDRDSNRGTRNRDVGPHEVNQVNGVGLGGHRMAGATSPGHPAPTSLSDPQLNALFPGLLAPPAAPDHNANQHFHPASLSQANLSHATLSHETLSHTTLSHAALSHNHRSHVTMEHKLFKPDTGGGGDGRDVTDTVDTLDAVREKLDAVGEGLGGELDDEFELNNINVVDV